MATKYVDVDSSMIDDVYELVRVFVNPDSTYDRWSQALRPPWNDGRHPGGFAAVVDGRMVAYLGLLFVDREIDGQPMKMCNIHSLITLPEHRGAAARMMLRCLKQRQWTYTVFTPSRAVRDFLPGVGFRSMNERVQIIPTRGGSGSDHKKVEVEHDSERIRSQVDGNRVRLIDDHAGSLCRHLHLRSDTGECHIAYFVSAEPRRHAAVLSISDPGVFVAHSRAIGSALRAEHQVVAVALDSRMVANERIPRAVTVPFDARRFVRPGTESPATGSIDNLYSEFVVLGVPFVPRPTDEARQVLLPALSQAKSMLTRTMSSK